jgi:hypothetical protein
LPDVEARHGAAFGSDERQEGKIARHGRADSANCSQPNRLARIRTEPSPIGNGEPIRSQQPVPSSDTVLAAVRRWFGGWRTVPALPMSLPPRTVLQCPRAPQSEWRGAGAPDDRAIAAKLAAAAPEQALTLRLPRAIQKQ